MIRLLPKLARVSTVLPAIVFMVFGCATTDVSNPQGITVALSGNQEVPPVKTSATGSATVTVKSDRSVSGTITTAGIDAAAAHIHEGEAGKNGPVIVPFTKASDGTWSIAPGAKLTETQYASYLAGNLYINVHSAANKAGEIRGQLRPVK